MSASRSPSISRRGDLGQRDAHRLRHERHRSRRARVRLDQVELVVAGDRELDVQQPDHAKAAPRAGSVASRDPVEHVGAEGHRRDHAGGVAGVDAGLLDVLHDRPDLDVLAVTQGVDVDLDRVLEEAVEVDHADPARRRCAGGSRRAPSASSRAPWRARRARSSGAPERGSRPARRRRGPRRCLRAVAYGGDFRPSSWMSAPKLAAVLGHVDRGDGRAQQRHPGVGQAVGELQRRLAAELDDHALGLLDLAHAEHVGQGERLEVEAVARVVIGRDRLGVAVHHHRVAVPSRARSSRRGRSSSRTRSPARSGSGRRRGSRRCAGRCGGSHAAVRPGPGAPSRSRSRASRPRTPRRRCRPTCRCERAPLRGPPRSPARGARPRTRGRCP